MKTGKPFSEARVRLACDEVAAILATIIADRKTSMAIKHKLKVAFDILRRNGFDEEWTQGGQMNFDQKPSFSGRSAKTCPLKSFIGRFDLASAMSGWGKTSLRRSIVRQTLKRNGYRHTKLIATFGLN